MTLKFTEGLILFANSLAVLTVFLSFVSNSKERGTIMSRLCEIMSGCLLLFFLVFNWTASVYSEPLLIPMGALILFRVFTSDESIFDDLELMILLMLMILIKFSAMGIIVFAMLFYLIRVWKHRKCRDGMLKKALPFVVCIAPFTVKASWSLLLKHFNTSLVFAPRISWGDALVSLCSGKHEYAGSVTISMLLRLVTHPLVCGALLMLIISAVFYFLKAKNKPAEWKMLYFIFMPVFFLTMMFSLLITYLFIFNRFQAEHLVSFSRYALTFLGMPLLVQLFLLLQERNSRCGNTKSLRSWTVTAVAVFLFAAVVTPLINLHMPGTQWRKEADTAYTVYASVIQPEEKFTVLCREGNGMKNYIYRYFSPDNFTPVQWFNPVLPDKKPKLYQTCLSPKQLLENLNKTAGYVLLDNMDKTFFKDYKAIFAYGDDGYQQQALYRITPAGLKYIPQKK